MSLFVAAGLAMLWAGDVSTTERPSPASVERPSATRSLATPEMVASQSGPPPGADWREILYPRDQDAIRSLEQVWRAVLRQAREDGHAPALRALGAVVEPGQDRSDGSMPTAGSYRCRSIQMGSTSGGLSFVAYPWFNCRVGAARGRTSLTKTTGSQRTQGTIFPNGSTGIYAGSQAWGSDETTFGLYGDEFARDDFGVVQRLGPGRWRIVSPRPRQGGLLNILELRRD